MFVPPNEDIGLWKGRAIAAVQAADYLAAQLRWLTDLCEGEDPVPRGALKSAALARVSVLNTWLRALPHDASSMNNEAETWKARAIAILEIAQEVAAALTQLADECLNDDITREQLKASAKLRKIQVSDQDRDWVWRTIQHKVNLPTRSDANPR